MRVREDDMRMPEDDMRVREDDVRVREDDVRVREDDVRVRVREDDARGGRLSRRLGLGGKRRYCKSPGCHRAPLARRHCTRSSVHRRDP